MRASQVLNFQQAAVSNLRRPWQTFRDGQIWYGITKLGTKRSPLTTKQGNKHYYKGTGSSGYGKLNASGTYIMNWSKVRTYVVPKDLHGTELKALVSPNTPQIYQRVIGYEDGFKSPELAFNSIIDFIEYGENYNDQDLEKNQYLDKIVNPKVVEAEQAENIEVEAKAN
ncbi:mitochondrial 54S ribosomal protein YmL27 [Scheffersomyces xylosifermentans]|uniref:mitochondrial 54S ribosomal protein YmL27 n=1 Tax=Scheffersomyces xylosifermentans TaxID=1304137 RepID=UPI00315DA811